MRKFRVIGIGSGHPEQITIQAINALNQTDVLFITDKGSDKDELARFRREIIERYAADRPLRIVPIPDPPRDRQPADYQATVAAWHDRRAALYEALFREHLQADEAAAFLVWGDPSLYDSTIRILDSLRIEFEVIPGITSVQALTAEHRIPLNQIGAPVQITTGRLLSDNPPTLDTVVMLDGECAFDSVDDPETHIYWGAYLGTPDQVLISGKVRDVAATIQQTKERERRRKGWIMDTYLLRRPRR
ncbi:MAG: precorrin-6A synthase (deacetylating) [Proteobacteria bacterium]|nr:precorrin-6A synthase (deacetylating) [Pseudomonadota bacterium]